MSDSSKIDGKPYLSKKQASYLEATPGKHL